MLLKAPGIFPSVPYTSVPSGGVWKDRLDELLSYFVRYFFYSVHALPAEQATEGPNDR